MKRFALLLLFATPAFVQLPLTVSKSFTPTFIAVNTVSTMTITIHNPNAGSVTGLALTDHFPTGLVNAGPFPGTASTTCGAGSLFLGPTSVQLQSGTVQGNSDCTVTAPVTSASIGAYFNLTSPVISTAPTSFTGGSATLHVVAPGSVPALSGPALLLLVAMLAAVGAIVSRR
jgi:hypothetical protein